MASTKAQVRDRAANDLGLLRLGQSLQNQDDVRITKAVDEVYDTLKEKGLRVWATTGTVLDRLTPWVAGMAAMSCVETYGVSEARYARLVNKYGINGWKAEREIRNLISPAQESREEPTDY